MSFCFNIIVSLFLVILQTTVMPYWPLVDKFYDLLIPFIVYLGLSRPIREGVFFVLLLGFIMDNLCGGPFGLYMTSYFWLFVGVKGVTMFIQVANRLVIITLIIAMGVLLENVIILGAFAVFGARQQFAGDAVKIVTVQVLWAMVTGSLLLILFRNAQNRISAGFKAIYAHKTEQG